MASQSNAHHAGRPQTSPFLCPTSRMSGDVSTSELLTFLQALNIYAEEEDPSHKGWKQLKMMFEGENWKGLQTLIETSTITLERQKTPQHDLDAITTTNKSGEHFWYFWDELLLDTYHQPDKGIHSLSTRISVLINNCKFEHKEMRETLNIMLLQHTVRYHEAHNWIWLQDQQQLTYQSLLSHCQLLETWCKHYQEAKEKGLANLISLIAATASSSSIQQNTLTTHPKCLKCS